MKVDLDNIFVNLLRAGATLYKKDYNSVLETGPTVHNPDLITLS